MNCHCMVCVGSKRKNLYLGRNAIYIYFILCNASFLSRLLLPFLYLNICNSNGMVSKSCELWFFFSVFFLLLLMLILARSPKWLLGINLQWAWIRPWRPEWSFLKKLFMDYVATKSVSCPVQVVGLLNAGEFLHSN